MDEQSEPTTEIPTSNEPETDDEASVATDAGSGASSERGPGQPRLHRSSTTRLIGGVAGGIAERFDIDANVVRVVFVVLACLGGLGVAIYLAMWALIPRTPGDDVARERPPVSTSPWLYIALLVGVIVAALIFITTVSGGPSFGRGLAVSWLIFLVVMAVVVLRGPARRLTFRRFVALFFLGAVSLVILAAGAFLGFLASTGVPLTGGTGVHVWQPVSIANVEHSYRVEFGTSTINLSGVVFPASGYNVDASVGAGALTIEVPANAIVDLRTHIGAGTVSYQPPYFYGSVSYGDGFPLTFRSVPSKYTTASSRLAAPHLYVNAQVGLGHILIYRARS